MARFFSTNKLSLLTYSICLAHAAYFFPHSVGFFSVLFLIPLFYAIFSIQKNAAWYGFYWGALFFTGHIWWVIATLAEYVEPPWHIIVYVTLTFYFILITAFWFWLANFLSAHIATTGQKMICWAISACIYYYFLQYYSCWFLQFGWGDPLISPLIPLTAHVFFVSPVAFLGVDLYQVLIIIMQAYVAWCIKINNRKGMFIIVLISIVLLGLSYWYLPTQNMKLAVGCIAPIITTQKSVHQVAYELTYELIKYADAHRDISLLCAPESAFSFVLEDSSEIIALWHENIPLDEKVLIVGAYTKKGDALFNSMVGISDGRIVFVYHKRNIMPFIEYENRWHVPIFTKKRLLLAMGKNDREIIQWGPHQLVPFICSELFFERGYPAGSTDVPLVCLVNDSHFSSSMSILLLLHARLKAIAFGRVIVYCSHRYGIIIKPGGTMMCAR